MQSIRFVPILLLSVVALCGCRSVHQQPAKAKLQAVNPAIAKKVNSSQIPKTDQDSNPIQQVGFLQEASDSSSRTTAEETDIPSSIPFETSNRVSGFDDGGQTLSLADIEQMALSNNPALAAANATVAKSTGLFHQVGARPNPTLGYNANQLADQGTDQHSIFLEQEFVRGNKLALNREVLRHTNDAQRFEIETQRYRILTDVRVRYYEAIAWQRQLDITHEFSEVAQRGVEVAESLQDAGEGTIIDVLQSKTLLSEINLAIEQAEANYRGAWKDLAAIAGTPDLQPVRLDGEFETPANSQDWESAYQTIASESPELAAANAVVCEKRAFLRRQQVQAVPNVTAQLGAGYDRATDNGLINFQIGAPIPIRNKNCGNIAAARADYARALENVKRIELAIKSRLARSAQEFESANASVQKYEQEILPQAKESLDLSEKAYRAGELAFLQVLTVRRNYYDSNIRFIQAQGERAQASANIDGLLLAGGLDAPLDYTDGDGLRGQSFGGQ